MSELLGPWRLHDPEDDIELSTPVSLEDIRRVVLHDPSNRDRILGARAARIERLTSQLTGVGQVENAEPGSLTHNFEKLYDPDAPTLVVDLAVCMREVEIIAQASQRRRQRDPEAPNMNIVFIRSDTDCASLVTDEDGNHALEVTHGIMVDAQGRGYAGALPEPVYSQSIETANPHFARSCEAHGMSLINSDELVQRCSRKEPLWAPSEHPNIPWPERTTIAEQSNEQLKLTSNIVIKPSTGSGGKGVRIFPAGTSLGPVYLHWNFLNATDYEPLVEKRIPSFELHDPETGEKLDWNVRTIVAAGTYIGAFIRVGVDGEAVNSANGSRGFAPHELQRYTTPDKARQLQEAIETAGQQIAHILTNVGFAGTDTIIDPQLTSHMLEVNVDQVGGVGYLDYFADEPEYTFAAPEKVIAAWLSSPKIRSQNPRMGRIVTRESPKADVIGTFKGLYELDMVELLSYVDRQEIESDPSHRHFYHYLWVGARYHRTNPRLRLPGEGSIEDDMLFLAPLELGANAARLALAHPSPSALLPAIECFEMMFGDGDRRLRAAREAIRQSYLHHDPKKKTLRYPRVI